MSPILHHIATTSPRPSAGDCVEISQNQGGPDLLDNPITLPTITRTVSIFVTLTELRTTTTTDRERVSEVKTTTVFLENPRTAIDIPQSAWTSSSPISTTVSTTLASKKPPPNPDAARAPEAVEEDDIGHTLPTGAVVGMTLGFVLLTAVLVICFVRQRLRRKRIQDRTWITPFLEQKPTIARPSVNRRQQKKMEYLSERWARMRRTRDPGASRNRIGETSSGVRAGNGEPATRRRHQRSGQTSAQGNPLAPPPAIYLERPTRQQPVQDTLLVSSLFPHGAVAKLHFEPLRRDELAVSAGDYLRVTALYDDGWALCKNNTGGKGMVPTACLRVNQMRRLG